MALLAFPTVLILSAWSLLSGVVAEVEEPCLAPVVADAVQACGWTGDCATCEDKCIPRAGHMFLALGQLVDQGADSMVASALLCVSLANVVNSFPETAAEELSSPARKVLGNNESGTEDVQAAAESLKDFFKAVSGKGLYVRSYKSRRLRQEDSTSSQAPSLACPNATEVDAAAQSMGEWFTAAAATDDSAAMQLLGPYMADVEKLKLFLEESCFTDTVTSSTNPRLFDAYAAIHANDDDDDDAMDSATGSDSTHSSSDSVPSSLTVCRPVGLEDETAYQLVEAYGTACGPDDTSVENGQCMSYTVSAPLSMACFSAGTDVLNATTDQIDDLRAAVLGVWSNCADLTTQADCELLSWSSEHEEATRLVSEIQAGLIDQAATNTTDVDTGTDTTGADTTDTGTTGDDTTGDDTAGNDTTGADNSAVKPTEVISMAETSQNGLAVANIIGFVTLLAALM